MVKKFFASLDFLLDRDTLILCQFAIDIGMKFNIRYSHDRTSLERQLLLRNSLYARHRNIRKKPVLPGDQAGIIQANCREFDNGLY